MSDNFETGVKIGEIKYFSEKVIDPRAKKIELLGITELQSFHQSGDKYFTVTKTYHEFELKNSSEPKEISYDEIINKFIEAEKDKMEYYDKRYSQNASYLANKDVLDYLICSDELKKDISAFHISEAQHKTWEDNLKNSDYTYKFEIKVTAKTTGDKECKLEPGKDYYLFKNDSVVVGFGVRDMTGHVTGYVSNIKDVKEFFNYEVNPEMTIPAIFLSERTKQNIIDEYEKEDDYERE